ncbi:MAG: hypothetical protein ACJ78M_14365 [Gemmatimonadaceae bacterium]
MYSSSTLGSMLRVCSRSTPFILLVALVIPYSMLHSQEHDDDHDHEHLHFSHPLVTESPSPDTKIRFDYLTIRTSGATRERGHEVRLEGEYAFTHSVSLAVVTPYVWRKNQVTPEVSGFGNVELSLKAASLALAEHGILLGGGITTALPTGSDSKEIGSSHLVEIESFLDAAYKRNALELVGFATLSSNFRRRAGEESERALTFDFSTLYRIQSRLEALIEATTERALTGAESGSQQTFIAPGLKIYPFTNKQLMFGASAEFGTGAVSDTKLLLLSAFYHF